MEILRIVDQRRQAVDAFLRTHAEPLARQGVIVGKWRKRNGRRLGPYFFLAVRDAEGRQRAIYLGRDAELIGDVKKALSALQAPRRQRQAIAAVRKSLRSGLAAAKRQLDAELAEVGLRRKGMEIRRLVTRPLFDRPILGAGGSHRRMASIRPTRRKAAAERSEHSWN